MGNCLTSSLTTQHVCNCQDPVQDKQTKYTESESSLICPNRDCEHSVVQSPSTGDNYDFLAKLLMVGPSQVGKTKLSSIITNEHKAGNSYTATIGVEFASFRVKHDQQTLKLQLWDSAGRVDHKNIVRSYVRGSHVMLLVCDRDQPQTLVDWLWSDLHTDLGDQTVCWLIADNHGKPDKVADEAVSALIQQLSDKQSLRVAGASVFDFTDRSDFYPCLHNIFKQLTMSARRSYNGVYQPAPVKKPAIYLYSSAAAGTAGSADRDKQLKVDIQLKGPLNIEIPTRDADSRWCCKVTGDQLVINDKSYPYIYWDANWPQHHHQDDADADDVVINTGVDGSLYSVSSTLQAALTSRRKQQFLMLAADYNKFSQQLLSTVLNDKERADFDEYWQPIFAEHPADTEFRVTVVDPDYFDAVFPLDIQTDAVSYQLFRLEFIFEKLSGCNVSSSLLPSSLAVQRPGLSSETNAINSSTDHKLLIVEWGGTILH